MNKKKIIIIGKNSFISQKFVNKFSEKKNIYIVKKKNNYYSKPNWLNLIGKDTTIVFLAFDNSLMSQKTKFFYFNKNILNFFNLFENYIKENKISPKIIFTSTVTVYGNTKLKIVNENFKLNPQTEYDLSKIFFEKLLLKLSISCKIKTTILRLSNVVRKIKNKEVIEVYGSGKYLRDYIDIDDLIEGIIKSIRTFKPGIYNLCSGNSYSLIYILKKIEKIMNIKIRKKFIKFPKNFSEIEKRNFIGSNKYFSKSFNWKTNFNLDKSLKKVYKQLS